MDKLNPKWPFYGPKYGDLQTVCGDANGRLIAVKNMDSETLEAALLVPGLQKTVEHAVRARIKKMGVQ